MKLSTFILSSIYFINVINANAISKSENEDIELLDPLRKLPHNVQINFKRDIPAEIDGIVDSNSVPIEDKQSSKSSKSSSNGGGIQPHTGRMMGGYSRKTTTTTTTTTNEDDSNEPEKEARSPLLMAISMIVVSEIGDKTFLISALMAMRHSRILVFTASFASLAIMTILSGIVGHALPTLISQRVTQFLAAGLFIIFGFKLTKEGLEMSKDLGVDEELAEVEEELEVTDMNYELNDLEGQQQSRQRRPSNPNVEKEVKLINQITNSFKSLCGLILHPVWIQVFVMIFLGEWGDRSQIATIAMAAGSDYWAVISGAVIGHGLCTMAAVIGGKILASRISMRTVTLGGAFAFFVFAILYFIEALNNTDG